ncbi:MAG: hypothetical protein ACN0LA_00105 [Candidatus Longimicrobiales bacterium M2_2A_002]
MATGGDTLILEDDQLDRLTWLGPGGEVLRTGRVEWDDVPETYFSNRRMVGVLEDGLVATTTPMLVMTGSAYDRVVTDTVSVHLFGADGSYRREIASIPGSETWVHFTGEGGSFGPVPFGAAVYHAAAANRFYLGRSDRYEVAVHRMDSYPHLLIRRADPPGPVTAADRAAYRSARLARTTGAEQRRQQREWLDRVPYSDTHPVFTGLAASADGRLWVREPTAPASDTAVWAIYGTSGLLEGRIRTPADLNIQQIGEDFLLALRRNALGVERLELWSLPGPYPSGSDGR